MKCISAKTWDLSIPLTLHRIYSLWSHIMTILTQIKELFCSTYELEDIFWWNTWEFKVYVGVEVIFSCSSRCVLLRVNCVAWYVKVLFLLTLKYCFHLWESDPVHSPHPLSCLLDRYPHHIWLWILPLTSLFQLVLFSKFSPSHSWSIVQVQIGHE